MSENRSTIDSAVNSPAIESTINAGAPAENAAPEMKDNSSGANTDNARIPPTPYINIASSDRPSSRLNSVDVGLAYESGASLTTPTPLPLAPAPPPFTTCRATAAVSNGIINPANM